MSADATARRGVVARADLLRFLADTDRLTLTLDHGQDGWFGYVYTHRDSEAQAVTPMAVPEMAPASRSVSSPNSRLQMSHVCAVVHREQLAPPTSLVRSRTPVPVLTDAHTRPRRGIRQVDYEDLIPSARLMPALVRTLGATRLGGLDVERLVADLCVNHTPSRLPRQHRQGWHPDLVVVLDFSERLFPFRQDMHRLARRLRRVCGRSAVSLRFINHGPAGPWSDWAAEQNRRRAAQLQCWRMPPAGTPVLIVSDLGLSLPHGDGSQLCEEWQHFVDRLHHANVSPMALAPVGSNQVGALAKRLPILRWSPDAPLRPVRGRDRTMEPRGLAQLLAMIALCRRVDPPLLRALRRLNPMAPHDAGLEGAAWSHPDVIAAMTATVRSECVQRYTHMVESKQLQSVYLELHRLQRLHHSHLPRALDHEESLLLAAHVDTQSLGQSTIEHHLDEAQYFLRQLEQTVAAPEVSPAFKEQCARVIRAILQRADAQMQEKFPEQLFALQEALVPYSGDALTALKCWIVCDIRSGEIRLQPQPAGAQQFVLNEALHVDAKGLTVRVGASENDNVQLISRGELPLVIAHANSRDVVQLKTSRDSITLGPIRRPRGIKRWWCDAAGIELELPPFGGVSMGRLTSLWPDGAEAQGLGIYAQTSKGQVERTAFTSVRSAGNTANSSEWYFSLVGTESYTFSPFGNIAFDEFGVFLDVSILGRYGRATQRFRHIEPGTFWMGSPEGEPEREDWESPQHQVTLTQGFWLADTACTQELWRAVMGSNPSGFKGDGHLPVENVSWREVQKFLRVLEGLLPSFHADLPTEAEWEYACRAGTSGPFSFGKHITPAQANYHSIYPYRGGVKGAYRQRTVPVKNLPANLWGLYEMHGNVWEWCADAPRKYRGIAVTNPVGTSSQKDVLRVLRGGSWVDLGRGVRSAYRRARVPDDFLHSIGFRMCWRASKFNPFLTRQGETGESRPDKARPKNFWRRLLYRDK